MMSTLLEIDEGDVMVRDMTVAMTFSGQMILLALVPIIITFLIVRVNVDAENDDNVLLRLFWFVLLAILTIEFTKSHRLFQYRYAPYIPYFA